MARYKVISLDMFQTLVDVNSRRDDIWKQILGEKYSKDFARVCWKEADQLILGYFNEYVGQKNHFYPVKYIFEKCYETLFLQRKIDFSPKEAAKILIKAHGKADMYDDVEPFLHSAGEHFSICLASDTDTDMVLPWLKRFSFDKVFLSESLLCYKFQKNSRIFSKMVADYQVDPKEIIHIGDGYSDVAGANRAGIATCWLNRNNKSWDYEIKPDYIVSSLAQLSPILGIDR